MARTVAKKNQPKRDFAKELEDALDLELADGLENGDLDIAASMEDLEAQISAAAEELARENRDQNGDGKVTVSEKKDTSTSAKETAGNAPGANTAAPASSVAAPDKAGATASKPLKTEDAPVDRKNLTPVDPAPENNASQPFAPANDDRAGDFSAVMRKFDRRAPNTAYWLVAVLSALWIGGGILLGQMLYGSELWQIRSTGALLAAPHAIALLVGIVVPVILFWGFAVMVRRAQEMRLAAQSMAEAAFRLAEPENLAHERIMTVGQAVRREVQAMGDGMDRTLTRAVELESLVHTEVSELERAYSENESRIRHLVDGLGSEREGIVGHAERVRASIAGAHEILKDELDTAGERIRATIAEASKQLAASVNASSEALLKQLDGTGGTLHKASTTASRAFRNASPPPVTLSQACSTHASRP